MAVQKAETVSTTMLCKSVYPWESVPEIQIYEGAESSRAADCTCRLVHSLSAAFKVAHMYSHRCMTTCAAAARERLEEEVQATLRLVACTIFSLCCVHRDFLLCCAVL